MAPQGITTCDLRDAALLSAEKFLGGEELAAAFWLAAGVWAWLGDVWRKEEEDILQGSSVQPLMLQSFIGATRVLSSVGRLWHHLVALGAGSCPSRGYPRRGDCRKAGGTCTSEVLHLQG